LRGNPSTGVLGYVLAPSGLKKQKSLRVSAD